MKNELPNMRRGTVDAKPAIFNLMENPGDFTTEDHMRMGAIRKMMDQIAGQETGLLIHVKRRVAGVKAQDIPQGNGTIRRRVKDMQG